MSKEALAKYLAEQERLGYPSFKQAIAKELVQVYGVPKETAHKTVFSESVQQMIDEDIAWAQQMGVGYWATEIINNQWLIEKNN